MRDIKFRYWDSPDETMRYNSIEMYITIDGRPHFWSGDECLLEGKSWCHKLFPLMQFTGEKDGEGADIYEGDILQIDLDFRDIEDGDYDHATFEVFYKDFAYRMKWIGVEREEELSYSIIEDFELKELHFIVVGNIYENKDLITTIERYYNERN